MSGKLQQQFFVSIINRNGELLYNKSSPFFKSLRSQYDERMIIVNKSEEFKLIEQCFSSIKSNNDESGNIARLERALSRIFDLKFHIFITDNTSGVFFGMNIYPAHNIMDRMIDNIVVDKPSDIDTVCKLWAENNEWYLEIDSILLYDMNLNASPAEMTAVLLHEIGHIVYSNTIPQRISKILRYKLMRLNYQTRALAQNNKIRKLFKLTILESCSIKNFRFDNKKEHIADKFVVHYGYGEYLDSFIGKLIKSQGNQLVNRSDSEVEQDIDAIVNWTVNNLKGLEFRKNGLRTALKVEMLKSPSKYVKDTVEDIYQSLFRKSTDKYRELLSEQYSEVPHDVYSEMQADENFVKMCNRIVAEASHTIFDNLGKLKKVQQVDIDVLQVEVDKIRTNDDKIYLLDRLYGMLETVNMALDYISLGKEKKVSQSKSTLTNMKDQLERIREEILAVKIIDSEYGVFIRYPKGYQG